MDLGVAKKSENPLPCGSTRVCVLTDENVMVRVKEGG